VNNLSSGHPNRHFVVLVGFEGKAADPTALPRVWVIPFPEIEPFRRAYAGGAMRTISRAAVLKEGARIRERLGSHQGLTHRGLVPLSLTGASTPWS
jgi:hypothetical protein